MGLDPAHRTEAGFKSPVSKFLVIPPETRNLKPETAAFRTPAGFLSGTHKNLQRLVIYPIYSVVKYRPHQLALDHPA